MITEQQMQTVLVSTESEPTGHERLLVAFRDGEDLFIPLDAGRHANEELLAATQLYIRDINRGDEYGIYQVLGHQPISVQDRQRLEGEVHKPISVETEVLHVTGTHLSVGQLQPSAQGFVAVIDGSERALRALGPAAAIADWYGRSLSVCAVTAGPDDRDTRSAVHMQIEDSSISESDVMFVPKADLEAQLFELMRQGQILVASAFGVWAPDGRLHGMLNGLVSHNAPAIIAIGPNVPADWKPTAAHPIVVCVDATEHAHDLANRIDPFITPPRSPLVVLHITDESPPNTAIAGDVAREIHERCGLPVEATNIGGYSIPGTVGTFAATVNAQMLIMKSWHRPSDGHPNVSSTSVTSVAHAPCPVAILSSQ